jgi:hypothetical protein
MFIDFKPGLIDSSMMVSYTPNMVIAKSPINLHWNYFLALESDMERVARFVEFNTANYSVYSIELAHLLFASASEFEVVCKKLCEILDSSAKRECITDYRNMLNALIPDLADEDVQIPKYGLDLQKPLGSFKKNRSPIWWQAYNSVKHTRHEHFAKATLKNALNSLASLALVCLYYEIIQLPRLPRFLGKRALDKLKPGSTLFRFDPIYYTKATPKY